MRAGGMVFEGVSDRREFLRFRSARNASCVVEDGGMGDWPGAEPGFVGFADGGFLPVDSRNVSLSMDVANGYIASQDTVIQQ